MLNSKLIVEVEMTKKFTLMGILLVIGVIY